MARCGAAAPVDTETRLAIRTAKERYVKPKMVATESHPGLTISQAYTWSERMRVHVV